MFLAHTLRLHCLNLGQLVIVPEEEDNTTEDDMLEEEVLQHEMIFPHQAEKSELTGDPLVDLLRPPKQPLVRRIVEALNCHFIAGVSSGRAFRPITAITNENVCASWLFQERANPVFEEVVLMGLGVGLAASAVTGAVIKFMDSYDLQAPEGTHTTWLIPA